VIVPMTDAQNFSGKAYTIWEGETLVEWLRRGSNESGEAREKFKATIYHNVRMALRDRIFAGQRVGAFDEPTADKSRQAYEEVQAWAVAISREAGLNDWSAELLPAAVQRAYEIVSPSPGMTSLVVDRMSILIDPTGGGSLDVFAGVTDPGVLASASAQATRWAQDAIVAAKVAPGNPYGDDDEAIAEAILVRVRAERDGLDPFMFVVNA
jgi:hypothetical protein